MHAMKTDAQIRSSDPRFEAAIDSAVMRPWFEDRLRETRNNDIELLDVTVPRVFPRKDGGFTIQYRLVTNGRVSRGSQTTVFCGRLILPSQSLPSYIERHRDRVFVSDDERLVVPIFPFDPELPQLDEIFASPGLGNIVAALQTDGEPPTVVAREILGYRLERRCVLRYSIRRSATDGKKRVEDIIVKLLRARAAAVAANSMALLESSGFGAGSPDALTVAKTIQTDISNGVLVMEAVPGMRLDDLAPNGAFESGCSAAARLLSKLHAIPPTGLRPYSVDDEVSLLEASTSFAGRLFPQWSDLLHGSLDAIRATVPERVSPAAVGVIHGDFYDKQVMYAPTRSTLLDCDDLRLGDRAQDHGNFAAHLLLRSLQHPTHAPRILRGIDAFEKTYAAPDDRFVTRARWWRATTLVRLAALYSLRPGWRHLTTELLQAVAPSVRH
jgi:hypothetical protein